MSKAVLIIDDDPTQRRLLQGNVERAGYYAKLAEDGASGLKFVKDGRARVDVVLLDLVMPGMGGMEVLAEIKSKRPELPVIVLTAQGGVQTVVDAMKAGASDFVVKPASPERIAVSLENTLKVRELTGEVTRLARTNTGALQFDDMIAGSPSMARVVSLGKRAAKSNIPILITGESGVGKELVARAIQGESERSGGPFITVNCGAIPENLVESILFGHEKGAFTGAAAKHDGKFKEADGGTLFLDEVGELPLDMQVKLLRALQEGEIDPVGSKRPVKVDVRIISATNRNLAAQVRDGAFREDLFYRLNVFPIEVPSLRERKDDIPDLVDHFITRFNTQEGRAVKGCKPETLSLLRAFDWPGNVRQLENAVFRAVILAEDALLQPQDFPQLSAMGPAPAAPASSPPIAANANPWPAGDGVSRLGQPAPEQAALPVDILDPAGHLRRMEEIERDLIQYAIQTYEGHMSEVARRLNIGRSTLYRKVREYGLDVKQARAAG